MPTYRVTTHMQGNEHLAALVGDYGSKADAEAAADEFARTSRGGELHIIEIKKHDEDTYTVAEEGGPA